MIAHLEHANFTVTDPDVTADWMCRLFGWKIRWTGAGMTSGRTVHVGTESHCLCLLYTSPSPRDLSTSRMPSSA